jgi:hypothetical protein
MLLTVVSDAEEDQGELMQGPPLLQQQHRHHHLTQGVEVSWSWLRREDEDGLL